MLSMAGGTGAVLLAAGPALAYIPPPPSPVKRLMFHNLHTGERLETVYWARGSYRRSALIDIDHILRDWRTGDVTRIDRDLLNTLHDLSHRLGSQAPIEVISGYRTAKTNAMLMKTSTAVARNSFHVRAKAIDIRLGDVPLSHLRQGALEMQRGGVGYYPSSNFVHVDTGPVRRW
jgi:uncharacterized protein YcbK (DUF882 family)